MFHEPGRNVLLDKPNNPTARDHGANVTVPRDSATNVSAPPAASEGALGVWTSDISIEHGTYSVVTMRFRARLPDAARQRFDAHYRKHLRAMLDAAALPKLAEHRAKLAQTSTIPQTLEKLRNDLAINELEDKLARKQLSGEALAERLVQLDRQWKEWTAKIGTLTEGQAIFNKTQHSASTGAHDEIRRIAEAAAAEASKDLLADLAKLKAQMIAAVESQLEQLRDLDFEANFPVGGALAKLGSAVPLPYVGDVVVGRGIWADISTDPLPEPPAPLPITPDAEVAPPPDKAPARSRRAKAKTEQPDAPTSVDPTSDAAASVAPTSEAPAAEPTATPTA
jgi:hypothetical protein